MMLSGGMHSKTSSVASDLTEKIREYLKKKDANSSDWDHQPLEESKLTDETFLGEPSEVFPYHFHRKTMRDRNK